MGTPDDLGVSTQRVGGHHAQLSEDGQNVPAGDVIAHVQGDASDPIVAQFLTRLRMSATLIGDHTDLVRAAVKQNADALKQAADDLMNVDATGATDFAAVTTIVDETSTDTTDRDVVSAAGSSLNNGEVAPEPAAPSGGGTTAPAGAPTGGGSGDKAV